MRKPINIIGNDAATDYLTDTLNKYFNDDTKKIFKIDCIKITDEVVESGKLKDFDVLIVNAYISAETVKKAKELNPDIKILFLSTAKGLYSKMIESGVDACFYLERIKSEKEGFDKFLGVSLNAIVWMFENFPEE